MKIYIVKIGLLMMLFCWPAYRTTGNVYETMMQRIRDKQFAAVTDISSLETNATTYQASLGANGSWPDINYADQVQTNWTPIAHLDRLKNMVLAYTHPAGSYHGNAALQAKIVQALNYWYDRHPVSSNWYMQQIASPQRVGILLILMRAGVTKIPADLENKLLARMASEGGRPDQSGSQGTGANKLDIATHWVYRGCLTGDASVVGFGVQQVYYPLVLTTGEGLQHDFSYQQHGKQLYIGGYGNVVIGGTASMALYTAGTPYALPADKLELLSRYTRDTYLRVIRGQNFLYNVSGRSLSRPGALRQSGFAATLADMKSIDPIHAAEYDDAINRLNGSQEADHGVIPVNTHYWRSDYTLHTRSGFSFDVRMISSRTLRNENGNGENIKGYFLSDGATDIAMEGNEYTDVFPVWDWTRIPGTTAPGMTSIPRPAEWGTSGSVSFAGGVSDGVYGISAYAYRDVAYNINTIAQKAWFMFDNEVVCLGAGIKSTGEYNINTTVNQCLLGGLVTVSAGSSVTTQEQGERTYNNLNWALHNGIGYFFPAGGKVTLSNQQQTGSWASINTSQPSATVAKDVFKLWFDHGVKPSKDSYAYIVAPGLNTTGEMNAYPLDDILILANTDTLQVVYHKRLNIFGMVFYTKATFANDTMSVRAGAGCILMLKNVGTPQVEVHITDPTQTRPEILLTTTLPSIAGKKELTCTLPVSPDPYAGSSKRYTIDKDTPNAPDTPTGISDPDGVYSLVLYPNPVRRGEPFHIDFPSEIKGSVLVKITNMSGRTVSTVPCNVHGRLTFYDINLYPGLYMVSAYTQQGISIKTVKMLVE